MNTVSLEVAKKLKAAGWADVTYGYFNPRGLYTRLTQIPPDDQNRFISAPTLGELMRMLPKKYSLTQWDDGKWVIRKPARTMGYWDIISQSDTPEDAAALAYIALQEGEK